MMLPNFPDKLKQQINDKPVIMLNVNPAVLKSTYLDEIISFNEERGVVTKILDEHEIRKLTSGPENNTQYIVAVKGTDIDENVESVSELLKVNGILCQYFHQGWCMMDYTLSSTNSSVWLYRFYGNDVYSSIKELCEPSSFPHRLETSNRGDEEYYSPEFTLHLSNKLAKAH